MLIDLQFSCQKRPRKETTVKQDFQLRQCLHSGAVRYVQESFKSRLLEIRHITEVLSLAPKGREAVNLSVILLNEPVEVSLAEMTAGQPGFKGMTVEIWE